MSSVGFEDVKLHTACVLYTAYILYYVLYSHLLCLGLPSLIRIAR